MFTNESWDMNISGGEMVWSSDSYLSNEMANAVRWANLQNITIITEAEPTIGNATFDFFKPGAPESANPDQCARTSIPVEAACCFFDGSCTTDFANDCTSAGGDYQAPKWCVLLIPAFSPRPERAALAPIALIWDQPHVPPRAELQLGWAPDARTTAVPLRPAAWLLEIALPCFQPLASPWVDRSKAPTVPASCSVPSCEGDVDNDGFVNFNDLIQVLANWGVCPDCAEDVDASGTVDFKDVLSLLSFWGEC